jgi:flagellar export protein FliJ
MPHHTDPLETLVKLRRGERDRRQLEHAEARRHEQALLAKTEALQATRTRVQADLRHGASPGEIDVQQLRDDYRYSQELQANLAELTRQQHELAQHLTCLHVAFVAAERELRTLENLRDQRAQREQAVRLQVEARGLDEIVVQKVGVAPARDFSDK